MKTRDEFDKLLKLAADPDKVAEALLDIREALTELYDNYEGATKKNDSYASQVNDLRDMNTRLFLRVTGEAPQEEQEPDILETVEKRIFDKLNKGE